MNQKAYPHKIEISYKTIVFTVIFLVLLWFLYVIRDVIFQIFVALLIMAILNPTVTRLQKLKIPRIASVLIVYSFTFTLLSMSVAAIIPPLVDQTSKFTISIPEYVDDLKIPGFIADQITREVTSQLGRLPSQLVRISVSIFSNVMAVFAVFVFALYFLLARDRINDQLSMFFKHEEISRIDRVIDKLENKLGGWARGEIILMLLVGFMTYIGLVLIRIPFALPLALLAGILEIVPNIGPIIASIPPILVGFSISPVVGVAAAALGLLVQQVENYAFVPKVMQKSAGVSPIITLVSLLIGFRLAGIVGAMLSVPMVISLQVLLEEFVYSKDS
jgi:predicted PurR-regulated permease PerM